MWLRVKEHFDFFFLLLFLVLFLENIFLAQFGVVFPSSTEVGGGGGQTWCRDI